MPIIFFICLSCHCYLYFNRFLILIYINFFLNRWSIFHLCRCKLQCPLCSALLYLLYSILLSLILFYCTSLLRCPPFICLFPSLFISFRSHFIFFSNSRFLPFSFSSFSLSSSLSSISSSLLPFFSLLFPGQMGLSWCLTNINFVEFYHFILLGCLNTSRWNKKDEICLTVPLENYKSATYSTVQYNTVQYSTVQYSTVQSASFSICQDWNTIKN